MENNLDFQEPSVDETFKLLFVGACFKIISILCLFLAN